MNYTFSGFSKAGNAVVRGAIAAAQDMGHTYVGTEHLLLALVRGVETVTAFVREVMQWGGVESALFAPLFKTVAIALVSRTGADLCRDAGEGAMASLVETAGAFGAVVVSLPLFGAVWELLSGMI